MTEFVPHPWDAFGGRQPLDDEWACRVATHQPRHTSKDKCWAALTFELGDVDLEIDSAMRSLDEAQGRLERLEARRTQLEAARDEVDV